MSNATIYVVELRPNRFSSEDTDAPEGYIGIVRMEYDNDGYPMERYGIVSTREKATEFLTMNAATRMINSMPDAFWERYYAIVCPQFSLTSR